MLIGVSEVCTWGIRAWWMCAVPSIVLFEAMEEMARIRRPLFCSDLYMSQVKAWNVVFDTRWMVELMY